MALLSIITGNNPVRTQFRSRDEATEILTIDVTTSDSSNFEADLTEHPVEDGPDVTDHYRPKAAVVNITGEISETPITLGLDVGSLGAAAGSNIAGAIGAAIVGGQGGALNTVGAIAGGSVASSLMKKSLPPADLYRERLEQLISKKEIFTIVTKRRKFSNMMVTSLTFPREAGGRKTLKFSMVAKEVVIVSSEEVPIQKVVRQAAAKVKTGKQATKATTAQVQSKASLLLKGSRFVGNLFGGGG